MSGFLLDTNIVSELVRTEPDSRVIEWLDAIEESLICLSVLTLGEIRHGAASLAEGAKRNRIETWLEIDLPRRFVDRILPVDAKVADRWGWIRAESQKAGMTLPIVDSLLAATALDRNLVLVTRNVKDFANIGGLVVLNPWDRD